MIKMELGNKKRNEVIIVKFNNIYQSNVKVVLCIGCRMKGKKLNRNDYLQKQCLKLYQIQKNRMNLIELNMYNEYSYKWVQNNINEVHNIGN